MCMTCQQAASDEESAEDFGADMDKVSGDEGEEDSEAEAGKKRKASQASIFSDASVLRSS